MKKPAPNAAEAAQHEAVDDRAHAVLADAEVEVRPAYVPLDVAAVLISVSVEGREVGEPPTSSGTLRRRPLDDLVEALRVAIMPASGPFFGTSASQPSGSRARGCARTRAVGGLRGSLEALAPLASSSSPRSTHSRKCASASSGRRTAPGSASRRPPW
jgi:hypothetical protein